MKVLFCTNIPSPYRVDFFNELGKYCDLTVLYERKQSAERDSKWIAERTITFKKVYLDLQPIGIDQSKGNAISKYIKNHDFDFLILTNYASPAVMNAIMYCKFHRIPYCIEYDGGFNRKDKLSKRIIKKLLLCGAQKHLTTSDEHIAYLMSLGIKADSIFKYPFTSLTDSDFENANPISNEVKVQLRKKLGMTEGRIILSVGRFSYENGYGKGYDVLLEVSKSLNSDTGVYIVGDEPTEEFIELKRKNKLDNVHFVGFKVKEALKDYYAAADMFILLTRGDVWGLVINEAMMYGLPIITTPFCVAGKELVVEGENGYLVELNDVDLIRKRINSILCNDDTKKRFSRVSRERISEYSITNMAKYQYEILSRE